MLGPGILAGETLGVSGEFLLLLPLSLPFSFFHATGYPGGPQ